VGNGGRGVHIGPTSARADVVNNTDYYNFNPEFMHNGDRFAGQMDSTSSEDVRFINNVSIARPGRNGFDVWASSGIVKANNIFFPVSRDESGGGGYMKIADPGFTRPGEDPNTADFRPKPGSPLIGGGAGRFPGVLIPRVDILGKPRPENAPAIGAFEP
jgi:hypothetical protein